MTICIPGQESPSTELKRSTTTNPKRVPRFNLLPEAITGYPLYDCSRDDFAGFYLVQPQEAYNLVNNPTFFKSLDSWSTFNAKMLRTNNWSYDSGFSVRVSGSGDLVTAERRAYIETEILDFIPGDVYTLSARLYLPQIWDTQDPYMGTISIVDVDGLAVEEEVFSTKIDQRAKWIELTVTKKIRETAENVYVRLNLRSQDQQELFPPYDPTGEYNIATEYIYFDMIQFESGTEATLPFHGSTSVCSDCTNENNSAGGCGSSGYSWTGEEHNSPSYRSLCARDGGKLICLSDELNFQMLSHTGHDMPPVRDISYPLANRPGELYQKTAIDARILTFTGVICESTLHQLECAIFGLTNLVAPDGCYCDNRFLLVYKHENCNEKVCDPERYLALCVTYIGGLEGFRDNLFQQRLALQFKAHDPFWFSWPGNQAQSMPLQGFVRSPNVVKIAPDGTVFPIPIGQGLTINTAACLGSTSIMVGGEFTSSGECDCFGNLGILDCVTWCNTGTDRFASGAITTSTVDSNGNIIVGGEFSGSLAIIYPDGSYGHFAGYPGAVPNAIAAPFWAQVAVATDNGVYIQTNDGNWYLHTGNGPVYDIDIAPNGDIVIGGDFTEFMGVTTARVARYVVFDSGGAYWEGFDTGFDDAVRTVVVDPNNSDIYVGGDFLNTLPSSSATCVTVDGTTQVSSCNSQEIQFTQVGGAIYNVDIRMGNIVAREVMRNCTGFIRITASNSCGQTYNLLFGDVNSTFVSAGTFVNDAGETLYTINYNVDTSYSLTLGDCTSSNESFVNELDNSNESIVFLAPLELPAGTGFDDTLGTIEIQCISLTTSDTPDSESVKHIAKISGGVVSSLNDGVDMIPTVLAIHPGTGDLWIGGNADGTGADGLLIWNGMSFRTYGNLGAGEDVNINDIKFCADCSVIIAYDGNSPVSSLPSKQDISYNGNAAVWPKLQIQGPGNIESISDGKQSIWSGCLILQCGEVATFDFNNGSVYSNFRNNLNKFGFFGSKMDLCLSPKCNNPWSLFMSQTDSDTTATLIWQDKYYGLGGLCCNPRVSSPDETFYTPDTCCPTFNFLETCPDEYFCIDTGHPVGSIIYDTSCTCGSLWVSIDDTCPDDCDCPYIDGGQAITDSDGNCLCGDEDAEVVDCD